MAAETLAVANAYPSLVRRQHRRTYEGREIWALKVSDNVATDEAEPEVLFTANQHAREHLTVEMALYLLNELTSKYATDPRIKDDRRLARDLDHPERQPGRRRVRRRRPAPTRSWRKNRQPNAGLDRDRHRPQPQLGLSVGLLRRLERDVLVGDLPRRRRRSRRPRRSACATSCSRGVIGGVQQIKTGIDFHTYSELVLWPYGYTTADTTPTMTADVRNPFATLGQNMATTNGYTPEQASDLYIADGTIDDWLWGTQGIFGYTFEMYPRTSNPGFYPPDEAIGRRRRATARPCCGCWRSPTARTRRSARRRSTAASRTRRSSPTTSRRTRAGRRVGRHRAARALGARRTRADTTSNGAKQLGTTVSGTNDLVTGRLGGDADDVRRRRRR